MDHFVEHGSAAFGFEIRLLPDEQGREQQQEKNAADIHPYTAAAVGVAFGR
jgi:hypothetical protein